jgi:DNA modification methylase
MKKENPVLQWKEKKRPEPIQYFPAQLKEQYGEAKEGWLNKIFWGDNIQVIGHLLKEYRGKIDLIYIDPPFDSKKNYKKKIKLKSKKNNNDINSFEEKQYSDIWANDDYLQFMYERLIALRELLSDKGSIYLHCDWHKSHYIRCILDEVFGIDNYQNEIIWQKIRTTKAQTKAFGNVHDLIFSYTRSGSSYFKTIYKDFNSNYIKSHYKKDENGRLFRTVSMLQRGSGEARRFGDKLLTPPSDMHWIWSQERIDEAMKNGLIRFTSNGRPEKVQYLDEMKGDIVDDLWNDIYPINSQAKEALGYPTQKPEKLLERIIDASSNPGDIVFDCFMGSGTTQAVALKLGRRFIGADINLGAIQTTTKRLINIANNGSEDDENYYGFEVYNVNKHNSDKSEADVCVAVENNKLKINDFFSMKLSQKMNIEKGKENWRRFVEFIVIDLDYDGSVIRPSIIDIPSENELVKGEYDIPSDASKIKIKITDISLETFEFEITNIFF